MPAEERKELSTQRDREDERDGERVTERKDEIWGERDAQQEKLGSDRRGTMR